MSLWRNCLSQIIAWYFICLKISLLWNNCITTDLRIFGVGIWNIWNSENSCGCVKGIAHYCQQKFYCLSNLFFSNCDLLHSRLNSHYEAWRDQLSCLEFMKYWRKYFWFSFITILKWIRTFPCDALNSVLPVSTIFQKNSNRPGPLCLIVDIHPR